MIKISNNQNSCIRCEDQKERKRNKTSATKVVDNISV